MRLIKHWGAIPNHTEKGESYMLIKTTMKILSKKNGSFTAKDGNQRRSYRVTYSQNEDEIVGDINVRQDVFDILEKGKEYDLVGEYLTTKNGNYIAWQSAKPVSPNNKGIL